ncbi:hypothetical protein NDU88_005256 [Pleurodeles waltl]|uniref:Uncharacterized protein n=1 Tax=Pleurodeles waltl TaxID=8319 RepID=A0AAV7WX32_PLEWA|nr:hypothetical protein NDU88_005256 [Pleurodeles waltl]
MVSVTGFPLRLQWSTRTGQTRISLRVNPGVLHGGTFPKKRSVSGVSPKKRAGKGHRKGRIDAEKKDAETRSKEKEDMEKEDEEREDAGPDHEEPGRCQKEDAGPDREETETHKRGRAERRGGQKTGAERESNNKTAMPHSWRNVARQGTVLLWQEATLQSRREGN